MNLKKLITALTAVLLMFTLAACSNNGGGKVLVKTDAGNITQDDLYNKLKKSDFGKQTLQQMAYMKLLKKKYKVTDKEVNQRLDQLKEQAGGEQGLQMFMQQQGIKDEDQLKDQLKQSLYLFKAATDGVKVSDKQMKDYYNKNKDQFTKKKVSHILVKKKSTAQTLEKQLKNGTDFASLAKKNSTDKGSAKKGGNVGYIDKNGQSDSGPMDPTFAQAAFKLKKGEVSDPVKTQFGYHIIKVTDVKVQPFSKVKDEIKQTLLQQKAKPTQEVFKKLNKQIDVKDDTFKDIFKDQQPQQGGQGPQSGEGDTGK